MDEGEGQEGEEAVTASAEEAPSEAPDQASVAAEQEPASVAAAEEAPTETVAEETTVVEEKTEGATEGGTTTEGVTEGATEAGTEATTEEKPPAPAASAPTIEKPTATASEVQIDERKSSIRVTESRRLRKVTSSRMSRTREMALGSTISFKKSSTLEMMEKGKIPRYMNTYKLWSDNPFNAEAVYKILQEIVEETITKLVYEADKIPKLTKWASGAIRTKVKELNYDRYKLVCLVTIGEKRSQDMLTFVRFLWDLERDRFAYYAAQNPGTFMLAMCFGLYFE